MRVNESLEAAFQQLKEMFSGATSRAVAGIRDLGEVLVATVGDDTSDTHAVHDQKHDIWTRFTDVLTGLSDFGRLYIPAGILFRLTPKGMGAHVIRGRKMRGPGASLVIPDGGDGDAAVVPGFDDSDLDENNTGILLPEGFHVESQNDRVRIVANSSGANGGSKSVFEMAQDGSATMQASGATIAIGSDGAVSVTSAPGKAVNVTPGAGGAVILDNGTQPVSRVNDQTQGHMHSFSLVAGPYGVSGAIISAQDKMQDGNPNVLA
jgi:hypothetical protein